MPIVSNNVKGVNINMYFAAQEYSKEFFWSCEDIDKMWPIADDGSAVLNNKALVERVNAIIDRSNGILRFKSRTNPAIIHTVYISHIQTYRVEVVWNNYASEIS